MAEKKNLYYSETIAVRPILKRGRGDRPTTWGLYRPRDQLKSVFMEYEYKQQANFTAQFIDYNGGSFEAKQRKKAATAWENITRAREQLIWIPRLVPPRDIICQALGYDLEKQARHIAIYWMFIGDEAMVTDGRISFTGHWDAYLSYVRHPAVKLVAPGLQALGLNPGCHFGNSETKATHWLILDLQDQQAYVARAYDADRFLKSQWGWDEDPEKVQEISPEQLAQIVKKIRQETQRLPGPDLDQIQLAAENHQGDLEALRAWLDSAEKRPSILDLEAQKGPAK